MKSVRVLFFALGIVLFLSGCNRKTIVESTDKEVASANTYTCVLYKELNFETPGEEQDSCIDCSVSGALKYKICLLDEDKHAEVLTASSTGSLQSAVIPCDDEHMILGVGALPDDSGFVTISSNSLTSEVSIETRDKKGELSEHTVIDDYAMTGLSMPLIITVDAQGNIHVDDRNGYKPGNEKINYCIFSPQGKLLKSKTFDKNEFYDILLLTDGRVAYDVCDEVLDENHMRQGSNHTIACVDIDTDKEETVYEYKEIKQSDELPIYAVGIFDENELVYMNEDGVFLSDYSMQTSSKIFDWKAAGIEVSRPFVKQYKICADKEGTIYLRAEYQKDYFMVLKPTPDNVKTIRLAIPKNSKAYLKAVAEFNMLYPEYRVSVEEYDYDNRTQLLTELVAGDGPLLLDADLVPFREKKEYWEPLDNVVDKEDLDNLNEFATKMGQIDDRLYGLAVAFNIDTIVSYEDIGDWSYDTCVDIIEDSDKLDVLIGMRFFENMQETILASYFFNAGIDDSYYLSTDDLNNVVDSEKMKRVLKIVKEHPSDSIPTDEAINALKNGRILGIRESVGYAHSFCELYTLYGEDIKIIGYPGKDGAKSYIQSNGMLLINRSYSEEEKEIAAKFIKVLLSYDVQKYVTTSGNPAFSTRKDVLDEQLEMTKLEEGMEFGDGKNWYQIGKIDVSRVKEDMYKLLKQCVVRNEEDELYQDIIMEEVDLFFEGAINEEELVSRLNKRLGLFFKERSH